ncbi:LuxR C-terminal-related transcriptional regulator [Chelatococcus reniformis]|uniref:HTH luxR-type domain-containing protein n=1 Tax=Chelatococcus reniformis TaxID=1494448 RepID=A0A916TY06_9HYPH|nr:LuxR C-terminal-related transcriptional regulator [Chelatococcus reniformis]GGC48863.1 hypothetical protein GCM10010994_05060 [Chelatococcus reniformis]
MVSENGSDVVGQLVRLASDIRSASSLDAAADAVLAAGQIIGMPNPVLVDNVLLERRLDRICAALGEPQELLDWWHSNQIGRIHLDVRRGLRERLPFRSWLMDGDEADLSPRDKVIREQQHDLGISSCIGVPVHLPDGGTAYVGWSSATRGTASSPLVGDAHFGLQAVAYAFIDALERMQAARGEPQGRPGLRARERDCVRLVASGCTVKEVARSLSLSPFTVREYLGNAMRRFEARNLPQLVSIAFRRGEIGLE